LGQISQGRTGLVFELMERFCGDPAVCGARQCQDRLTEMVVPADRRQTLRDTAADRAVAYAEVTQFGVDPPGDALGPGAVPVQAGPDCGQLLVDRGVVTFDHPQVRHGAAGLRVTVARSPVPYDAVRLGEF